jgi:glyoxylase I family protein
MEKVLGIGGFFWRSRDAKALGKWYETHLGIPRESDSYDDLPWQQQAGTTVFVPFKHDTTYFAPEQQWMINFRVRDVAELG